MKRFIRTSSLALLAGAMASQAGASLVLSGFDAGFTGSASGIGISGQDGWFVPAVAGAVDLQVFTHVGDALTFPDNPLGGGVHFAGLNNPGTPSLGRAQRNHTYRNGPNYISYDVCVKYSGTLPATQNVGSISLQDSVTQRFFIGLFTWVDPATAANWNMQINAVNALNAPVNNFSPGPEFAGLALNKWYRQEFVFDLATNQVLQTAVTDLTTGVRTSVNLTNLYLTGGTTPTLPAPTALRMFVGGTTAGNTMGFDNIVVGPPAATNNTATIVSGTPFGGDVPQLATADNDYFYILSDEGAPNGMVEVVGTHTGASSWTDIGVIVEVSSTRDDLSMFVRMKNYSAGGFTTVATATTSLTDKQVQAFVAGGGAAHVSSTGESTCQIEFIPQQDLEASDGWSEVLDRVSMFAD